MRTQDTTITGRYASADKVSDPNEMAARISEHVRHEAKQGRIVSYAEAAAHLEMHERSSSAHSLAQRITVHVDEQRALGNRVSYAEALQYVESH